MLFYLPSLCLASTKIRTFNFFVAPIYEYLSLTPPSLRLPPAIKFSNPVSLIFANFSTTRTRLFFLFFFILFIFFLFNRRNPRFFFLFPIFSTLLLLVIFLFLSFFFSLAKQRYNQFVRLIQHSFLRIYDIMLNYVT